MAQAIEIDGTLMLVCEWFAKCPNGTLKVAPHPILDLVPCCDRCARMANISSNDLQDVEVRSA
jgi:hypothetical protein